MKPNSRKPHLELMLGQNQEADVGLSKSTPPIENAVSEGLNSNHSSYRKNLRSLIYVVVLALIAHFALELSSGKAESLLGISFARNSRVEASDAASSRTIASDLGPDEDKKSRQQSRSELELALKRIQDSPVISQH